MFDVYIGPKVGITDEIVENLPNKDLAISVAKDRVALAKLGNMSRVASIFDVVAGVVVAGFATEDLRETVSEFSFMQIL